MGTVSKMVCLSLQSTTPMAMEFVAAMGKAVIQSVDKEWWRFRAENLAILRQNPLGQRQTVKQQHYALSSVASLIIAPKVTHCLSKRLPKRWGFVAAEMNHMVVLAAGHLDASAILRKLTIV